MENANGKDQEHEVLQSVIIGLKECEGRGGGLKREWRPNNFLPRALQSGFLFESWVGGGGGGGWGGARGVGEGQHHCKKSCTFIFDLEDLP